MIDPRFCNLGSIPDSFNLRDIHHLKLYNGNTLLDLLYWELVDLGFLVGYPNQEEKLALCMAYHDSDNASELENWFLYTFDKVDPDFSILRDYTYQFHDDDIVDKVYTLDPCVPGIRRLVSILFELKLPGRISNIEEFNTFFQYYNYDDSFGSVSSDILWLVETLKSKVNHMVDVCEDWNKEEFSTPIVLMASRTFNLIHDIFQHYLHLNVDFANLYIRLLLSSFCSYEIQVEVTHNLLNYLNTGRTD